MAVRNNGGGANKKHAVAPMEVSMEPRNADQSAWLDDDGRPRRTGTVWTSTSLIITAVVGSGVLSLAWSIAQLGWLAGSAAMLLFAFVTYYTATLLADCYRIGDPETGKRNYTYMDASPCRSSRNPYMILFGAVQILFSQIPDFDQIWWVSVVAAVMSFTYYSIGLSLGMAQLGWVAGPSTLLIFSFVTTATPKISFGDIAFAYSFSCILIEIEDTIKAEKKASEAKAMKKESEAKAMKKESEAKAMKKASEAKAMKKVTTATFYMLCGCVGCAAFGTDAYLWLLDIAIVAHLVGAYQPVFALVELRRVNATRPNSSFKSAPKLRAHMAVGVRVPDRRRYRHWDPRRRLVLANHRLLPR